MSLQYQRLFVATTILVGMTFVAGCGDSTTPTVSEPPAPGEVVDPAAEQAKREKEMGTSSADKMMNRSK